MLWITIALGAPAECTAETMAESTKELYEREFKAIAKPGFAIYVVASWLGCRNARPCSLHACAAHIGRIYYFDAPVFGWSGGPGFGPGAVDFLEQLGVP